MTVFDMYEAEVNSFAERSRVIGFWDTIRTILFYNPFCIILAVALKSKCFTSHSTYILNNYCEREASKIIRGKKMERY